MKTLANQKLVLALICALFLIPISNAQVGIGTTTPATGALLDLDDPNRGLLVPRVTIADLTTDVPVVGATIGLLVWNTDVVTGVGFHYWDGNDWIPLSGAVSSNNWALTGNAGTIPGTNFLGTTDATNLEVHTNSLMRLDVGSNGNVGIGTASPAGVKLDVDGGAGDGIFGHSTNVGGYLGRETNIAFGTPLQTISGAGVYANNPSAGYTSLFSQSTGTADVAASINYSDVWIASYNYVENGSATANPSALYTQLNITDGSLGGYKSAFSSYTNRGTIGGNPGYTVGGQFTADADNEDALGILAYVFSDRNPNNSGIGVPDLAGGEFRVYNYTGTTLRSLAWVANYNDRTDYKILGTGAVSTIVEDENQKSRIMFAPEAPEVLFQDFGIGTLINGNANIVIDPILAKNIHVSQEHPLKVFIQLEGDCNGVFVTNKTANGFTVKELQNGQSNVSFSWQIVANRKDRKKSNFMDESDFQDLRLPILDDIKGKLSKKTDKETLRQASKNKTKSKL